ncbi:hypothetical protein HPB50_016738 [Hyalomma asiaticum]|uniref:Uncharacterized protein n=1 Tax=Hyalomma asiaticum TaxID=266040 RepID=A0ACB7SZ55_HYAAI|nr:hypothetical protein HPB50_016738 [Hyalomma asiaticum]
MGEGGCRKKAKERALPPPQEQQQSATGRPCRGDKSGVRRRCGGNGEEGQQESGRRQDWLVLGPRLGPGATFGADNPGMSPKVVQSLGTTDVLTKESPSLERNVNFTTLFLHCAPALVNGTRSADHEVNEASLPTSAPKVFAAELFDHSSNRRARAKIIRIPAPPPQQRRACLSQRSKRTTRASSALGDLRTPTRFSKSHRQRGRHRQPRRHRGTGTADEPSSTAKATTFRTNKKASASAAAAVKCPRDTTNTTTTKNSRSRSSSARRGTSRQSPKRVLRADDETERRHAPGRRRHFRSESCSPEVLNRSSNVTSSGNIGSSSSSNNARDDDTTTFKSPTRTLMDSRVGFVVPMRPRTRSNPKPPPNRTSREFDAVTEVDQTTTSPPAAVRQPSFAASNKSSSLESPSRGHPQQTKTTSRSLEEKMSSSSSLPLQQTMAAPLVSPPPDPATAKLAQESKEREVMLREITGQTAGSFSALEEPVPAPRPTTLRQRRLMFSHLTASVDVDTREKPSTPPCLTAALAGSEDMLLSEVFNNSNLASSLEQLTGVARKTLRKRALVPPLQAYTAAGYDNAAGQP